MLLLDQQSHYPMGAWMAGRTERTQNLASFVWSIAEILRGDLKWSEYGKVVLPFVVMRRLDSKEAVLTADNRRETAG